MNKKFIFQNQPPIYPKSVRSIPVNEEKRGFWNLWLSSDNSKGAHFRCLETFSLCWRWHWTFIHFERSFISNSSNNATGFSLDNAKGPHPQTQLNVLFGHHRRGWNFHFWISQPILCNFFYWGILLPKLSEHLESLRLQSFLF